MNASFLCIVIVTGKNFVDAGEAIASLEDHSGSSLILFRARIQEGADLSGSALILCLKGSHFALSSLMGKGWNFQRISAIVELTRNQYVQANCLGDLVDL